MSRGHVDDSVRERLLKVLRLAQEGVGGEKENAETLLEKLLRKHGLEREDLELDDTQLHPVILKGVDARERQLAGQLMARLVGRTRAGYSVPGKRNAIGCKATASEGIAIEIAWDVYRAEWRKAQDDLLLAYCLRHQLFDPSPRADEQEPLSEEELEKHQRALDLAMGLQDVAAPVQRLNAGRIGGRT